jgi:hypothetical protein
MKATMMKVFAVSMLSLVFGSCSLASDVEVIEEDDSSMEECDTSYFATSSSLSVLEDGTAEGSAADPATEFSCNTCFVRCTDANPGQCKWTKVYNLGSKNNCGAAGNNFCANMGYTHSWAGCKKSATQYPGCCCDPNGYCSRC